MFADIVVKKGLNLSLVGQSAHKILNPKLSKNFSIYPSDFHGVFAKLIVKENDIVKAGDILFYDKNSPDLLLVGSRNKINFHTLYVDFFPMLLNIQDVQMHNHYDIFHDKYYNP